MTANVAPALCALLHAAWDNGDLTRFGEIRDLLDPLHAVLFLESNPIPVKAALAGLNLCTNEVRLPLTKASSLTMEKLMRVIAPVMRTEDQAARSLAFALAS